MALGTATTPTQTAVYVKTNTDATLKSVVTGVFSTGNVSPDQKFPYLVIGELFEMSRDTFSTRTYELELSFHIWDRSQGFAKIYAVIGRLNALLHRQSLNLSPLTHIGTWYVETQTLQEDDGITLHAIPRYKIIAQEDL